MHKSDLSRSRRQLVEEMQQLDFGRIESLIVCAGEPVWEPAPRVVREIMLGKRHGRVAQRHGDDFELKQQIIDLLELFERERSLEIECLEVQNGLPFRVKIVEKVGTESMP